MPTFALISEGLTDQIILERMIEQICGEKFEDGVDINPLQPLRDATDAATAPHAGWELVFEYCKNDISSCSVGKKCPMNKFCPVGTTDKNFQSYLDNS